MADIATLNLYEILEIHEDANEKEIVKAYRKKALKCHPDKNPDDPKAAETFHQLSKALELLTDAAARAAYDKARAAKVAAAERHAAYDSKRKRFKEDLESRENAAQEQKEISISAAERLQKEIQRLRKEGSSLLEEEQMRLREQLRKKKEMNTPETEDSTPKLKIRWKAKNDTGEVQYTKEFLLMAFSKYGEVLNLLVSSKKKGSAIVEFKSSNAACLAQQNEIGKPSCPLKVEWLSGRPSDEAKSCVADAVPISSHDAQSTSNERDFESIVLMRMRQAEERKRLIEQMQKEECDGT